MKIPILNTTQDFELLINTIPKWDYTNNIKLEKYQSKYKTSVLNRNNYLVHLDLDSKKYYLKKVDIIHCWFPFWSNPKILFCRLSSGWVANSTLLIKNKKYISQKNLELLFDNFFKNKFNAYYHLNPYSKESRIKMRSTYNTQSFFRTLNAYIN